MPGTSFTGMIEIQSRHLRKEKILCESRWQAMKSTLVSILQSGPLFLLLCILAVPMVLIRLFGFLFFAATTSLWALVPALVLAALIPLSSMAQSCPRIIAAGLLCAYLLSVLLHGWWAAWSRIAGGQSALLDCFEAAMILFLTARCLLNTKLNTN